MTEIRPLKARDIIPDWPRGRTTTPSFWLRPGDFMFTFGHTWSSPSALDDIALYEQEAEENEIYHRKQQEMVNTWHEADRIQFQAAIRYDSKQ